jgi:hypothetical protein
MLADIGQGKAESMSRGMVVISPSLSYKITPSRCKQRAGSGGCYYDPITFDAITPQTAIISPGPGLQDHGVEETDEVSCHSYFCWSLTHFLPDPQIVGVSMKTTLNNKWLFIWCYSLEQYSILSQVMHVGLLQQRNSDR